MNNRRGHHKPEQAVHPERFVGEQDLHRAFAAREYVDVVQVPEYAVEHEGEGANERAQRRGATRSYMGSPL